MGLEENFLIWIDPEDNVANRNMDAAVYESSVRDVVTKIAGTKTGKALLGTLKSHNKLIRIYPISDVVASGRVGSHKDISHNRAVTEENNKNKGNKYFKTKPYIGSSLQFTTAFCANGGPSCHNDFLKKNDFVPSADSVLFHEMTHILRTLTGKITDTKPVGGGLSGYGSEDEFYSTVLENIYLSETKGTLRRDWTGWKNVDERLKNSLDFFKVSNRAFSLIEKYCVENPKFTREIAEIDVPFNPIRAYYKNRQAAAANSMSQTAANRDSGQDYQWETYTR